MSQPAGRRLCLVTGASAGIGEAFARLYAAKGYDVALTARRADRLEALADALRRDHGVKAFALPGDLALAETPAQLIAELAGQGRCVDALINNAGYGLRGDYTARSWAEQQAFVRVLVEAPAALASQVLPGMVGRRFGRIVNVASLLGLMPAIPGNGLYSAAKAFVVRFSEGLHLETLRTGVHVTALCPGLTRSEFHAVADMTEAIARAPAWMWMSSQAVAEAGYAAVENNRPVCVPGGANKAVAALFKVLPERIGLGIMARQR